MGKILTCCEVPLAWSEILIPQAITEKTTSTQWEIQAWSFSEHHLCGLYVIMWNNFWPLRLFLQIFVIFTNQVNFNQKHLHQKVGSMIPVGPLKLILFCDPVIL